jgi:methyl-accepting chemotaxis protein
MRKFKISTQLMSLTGLLLFFFVLSNGISLTALRSSLNNTIYIHQMEVVPVNDIQTVTDAYAIEVPLLVHRVVTGKLPWEKGRDELKEIRAVIDSRVPSFAKKEIFSVDPEALPAFFITRDRANSDLGKLDDILVTKDVEALKEFNNSELRESLPNVWKSLDSIGDAKAANLALMKDKESAGFNRVKLILIGFALLSLAVGLTVSIKITRGITRALGAEPDALRSVAQGVGRGELYGHIDVATHDRASVMFNLAGMRDMLREVADRVRTNADNVASASSEIADGNMELSARTEQQAAALEETAASMEQLGSTVSQNAEHAQQASELARTATATAEEGGERVNELVETMRAITQGATRIAGISTVIESIAFQTNILALNAAVEAARVGEFGRGFAVVAGEVRSLAQRAAQSAKEINELVAGSVEQIQAGGLLADQAGEAMHKIVADNRRVSQLVQEISVANNEQSEGVRQVGDAIVQMDQTTQQNAAQVELSAAAADNLRAQSQELVLAVSVLKVHAVPGAKGADDASAKSADKRRADRELHLSETF